jgi:hypothetical protein
VAADYQYGQQEHRHLDGLADGGAIRGMIVSGGGWTAILELLAKAVQ